LFFFHSFKPVHICRSAYCRNGVISKDDEYAWEFVRLLLNTERENHEPFFDYRLQMIVK
jgi:hypothetical protein